jgi:hemoglobin
MAKDIANRHDIELLVNSFYDSVRKDELIGFIFNTIIGNDWSHHLPIMYRFWESVLLSKPGYEGNPVKKHIDIDKQIELQKEHFERWLALWNKTVDSLFSGEVAELAKNRASLMANLINIKVEMARDGKSLM